MEINPISGLNAGEPPTAGVVVKPSPIEHPMTPNNQLVSLANKLLLEALTEKRSEDELEAILGCTKPQIKAWCKNLVSEGLIHKLNRPVQHCKR